MLVIAACSPFVRRFLATYEQLLVQGAFSQAASLLVIMMSSSTNTRPLWSLRVFSSTNQQAVAAAVRL